MGAVAQTTQTGIIEHEPRAAAMTPMDMLNAAVSRGADIDVMTKLMDLHERWEKNQARKAFDAAISAAKAEIPVISKNRKVDFTSQKGRTNYRHEDMAEIARTVDPILGKYGLSYRFRTESTTGSVTVTCIVSHRDGYSEENTLSGAHDQSGNKNSIQAVGSTITYLQRYTLKAALGIAASNDDDGKSSNETPADDTAVTEAQASVVRELIEKAELDTANFCERWQIESIPSLKMAQFNEAVQSLRRRIAFRAEQAAKGGNANG